jgi:hypothetical protein
MLWADAGTIMAKLNMADAASSRWRRQHASNQPEGLDRANLRRRMVIDMFLLNRMVTCHARYSLFPSVSNRIIR